jgi:hypothetical protein
MASNLPFGSGVIDHRVFAGSPDPRRRPFGPGTGRYQASYAGRPAEGPIRSVPVSCRLSARQHSLVGSSCPAKGLRSPSVGLPKRRRRLDPDGFPRSTRTSCDRGERPLSPKTAVLPRPTLSLRPPLPLSSGQSYTLALHPIQRAQPNETSSRFTGIHPSGLPLACDPRMLQKPWAFPLMLRTPPLPATHVRAGTGLEHWPETTPLTSTSVGLPSYESTRHMRPRVPPHPGC